MSRLFDYIFYRWFWVYAKKDRDPTMSASVIVSAYQALLIVNLVSFGNVIFDYERPDVKFIIAVVVVLYVLNYFRYERNFNISRLDDRWRNEPKEKKKRNWMLMIAYLVITFTAPWIHGFATS